MKTILLLFVLCSGCAYNRPALYERTFDTNGLIVTERRLTMRSYVVWPASSSLETQRASLGKTLSVGTAGLGQEGGGTNVVAALREINSILDKLSPK